MKYHSLVVSFLTKVKQTFEQRFVLCLFQLIEKIQNKTVIPWAVLTSSIYKRGHIYLKEDYTDFEKKLLKFIYECRAVTFEQLAHHFGRTQNVIYKIVSKLSKQRLISTEGVSYIKKSGSNFQGKCVFLTSKGISILRKFDTSVNRSAVRNKPTRNQLPFVLLANEIKIYIDEEYWEFLDSRDAKDYFNRNYNELFNGLLRNKESQLENIIYVLPALSNRKNAEPSEKYFYLLSNELKKHYEQMKANNVSTNKGVQHYIHSYMFFCKSEEWFHFLLDKISDIGKGSFISRVKSVRVMPFNYGINLFQRNSTKIKQAKFVTELIQLQFGSSDFKIYYINDSKIKSFGIKYKMRFKGEESFVVDLMDFDLVKVNLLKYYTEDVFKLNGSKEVIVITSTEWREFIERNLTYRYFKILFIERGYF